MAFSGDLLVAGSYHGFNAYRLGEDGMPNLVSSVVCPGGQGDVSIVGDLLFMSVQDRRARVDCGLGGVAERVSDERFRGLRIFDISDIARPVQVGQVQTCRGSHTHSVVSADDTRIVVYNSGTSYVRPNEELAGCFETGGDNTALFSIDVIEVPLANPAASRIASSARVFAEDERIAGLWLGGDHGEGTQDTNITDHCHDITVFPAKGIAAGACSGNGIVLDISDPLQPTRIDDVTETGFAYWHSATFNNDGTKVLFTDEWGGGGRPRCQAGDPMDWGANAIYELKDGKLEFSSLYKIPAPQTDKENCVAHNGSIIPVPGRDIFVQAWYQGGISVIDFTDAKNPVEIAYFDRGPVDEEQLVTGGLGACGTMAASTRPKSPAGSTCRTGAERIPHARGNRRRRGCAISRRAVQPADADAGDLARRSRPCGGRQPQGWLIAKRGCGPNRQGVSDARTERNQRHRGRASRPAGGGGARLAARYQSRFGVHARHAARALDLCRRRPRHRGYRAGARSALAGPRARHSRHRDQPLPLWPYTVLAAPQVPLPDEVDGMSCASVLSFNVLQDNARHADTAALIERVDPDILLLMETDRRWVEALAPQLAGYGYRLERPLDNTYGMVFATRLEVDRAAMPIMTRRRRRRSMPRCAWVMGRVSK